MEDLIWARVHSKQQKLPVQVWIERFNGKSFQPFQDVKSFSADQALTMLLKNDLQYGGRAKKIVEDEEKILIQMETGLGHCVDLSYYEGDKETMQSLVLAVKAVLPEYGQNLQRELMDHVQRELMDRIRKDARSMGECVRNPPDFEFSPIKEILMRQLDKGLSWVVAWEYILRKIGKEL